MVELILALEIKILYFFSLPYNELFFVYLVSDTGCPLSKMLSKSLTVTDFISRERGWGGVNCISEEDKSCDI